MPAPIPCVPCCSTPQTVNIPGIDGGTGPNVVTATTITSLTGILAGLGSSTGLVTALAIPLSVANGGTGLTASPIRSSFSPANPTLTASTTQVMMGFGVAGTPVQIAPSTTGTVLIIVIGVAGSSAATDGVSAQLYYAKVASVPAPANGAAVVGTALGSVKHIVAATGPGKQGFALGFLATGLTVGAAYWIDVALNAVTAGNASIYDVDIVAIEL